MRELGCDRRVVSADEAVRLDLDDRHVALLQKPYSADELNAAIDRLMRR